MAVYSPLRPVVPGVSAFIGIDEVDNNSSHFMHGFVLTHLLDFLHHYITAVSF